MGLGAGVRVDEGAGGACLQAGAGTTEVGRTDRGRSPNVAALQGCRSALQRTYVEYM